MDGVEARECVVNKDMPIKLMDATAHLEVQMGINVSLDHVNKNA